MFNLPNPNPADVEKYLKLKPGSFDHIPHYARESALWAIRHVMELERSHLFRPGLYYILLSDLCRSTEASLHLGVELNRLRVESFILNCIEALGSIELKNYAMFLREVGDAVLIIFSSFRDVLDWYMTMKMYLAKRDQMWSFELEQEQYKHFKLEAKTVVHAGEVFYSDENIPMAYAVNQVFKVEKLFKAGELGVTQTTLSSSLPVLKGTIFRYRKRTEVTLPGDTNPIKTYLIFEKGKKNWPKNDCTRNARNLATCEPWRSNSYNE
jgi:class 3 adenylate cyclase